MENGKTPEIIIDLLKAAMENLDVTSENALAVRLGMDRQAINKYKFGTKPSNENLLILCQAAEKDFNTTLVIVERAFAKTEEAKNRWDNYFRKLGGFAASAFITFSVTVTLIVTPTPAKAAPEQGLQPETLCIM